MKHTLLSFQNVENTQKSISNACCSKQDMIYLQKRIQIKILAMKKVILALLFVSAILGLQSCSSDDDSKDNSVVCKSHKIL